MITSQTAPKTASQPTSDATPQSTPAPTNPAPQNQPMVTADPSSAANFCEEANKLPKKTPDEIIACIQDRTNPNRVQCMDQGLCSASPNVRGAAIGAVYNGMSVLAFEVSATPGDEVAQMELTKLGSFSITGFSWDKVGGKSFRGSCCVYLPMGNIVGNELKVTMENKYRAEKKDKATGEILTEHLTVICEISVTLNKDRSAMEGSARCQGIKPVFKARLGFGG